jgi:hypothetical protein
MRLVQAYDALEDGRDGSVEEILRGAVRLLPQAAANGVGPEVDPLRTRGVILERVRPLRWLWARRIPLGVLSLLVADEGIGKGTLASWIIARATRGELDGDLEEPTKVLIVGDEDGFDQIWVPRLYAAGIDLNMIRTLDRVHDRRRRRRAQRPHVRGSESRRHRGGRADDR